MIKRKGKMPVLLLLLVVCFMLPIAQRIALEEGMEAFQAGFSETKDSSAIPASKGQEGVESSALYLDGSKGSDDNDGLSPEHPLKSLNRAKAIASENKDIKTIYICGTVPLTGDVNLNGADAIIKRHPAFFDYLFDIKGAVTLSNIIVDGNKNAIPEDQGHVDSLIKVYGSDADLTIADGAVLKNNATRNSSLPTGGAIRMDAESTVTMTGGTIQDCEATWGGGVYVDSSTFTMTGGVIKDNQAMDKLDEDGEIKSTGAGGGICSWNGMAATSTIKISYKAEIASNNSSDMGGGISVGASTHSRSMCFLEMDGGHIHDNVADSSGGGIFVQAGKRNAQSQATISGGAIAHNKMAGGGSGNDTFGGAGIYVNGLNDKSYDNGKLQLTNAVITDNKARWEGGGYASCPSSETTIHVTSGAAFFGNHAASAQEIYIVAGKVGYGSHGGNPSYIISPVMLGGASYHWKDEDGQERALNSLAGELVADLNESLSLHTDQKDNETIKKLAKVYIIGNESATRGGGIGSNGSVFIGVESPEDELTEVSIEKQWKNVSKPLPECIKVGLYRSVKADDPTPVFFGYDVIEPLGEDWSYTFYDLPKYDTDGNEFIYTVKELDNDGFIATVEGNQADGYIIINSEAVSIPVEKRWQGDPAASVTVDLLADGKAVATQELSAEGGWKHVFENLPKFADDGHQIVYAVSEHELEGYDTTITGNAVEGFVITNFQKTKVPPTNPPVNPPSEPPTTPVEKKTPTTGDMAQEMMATILGTTALGVMVLSLAAFKFKKLD